MRKDSVSMPGHSHPNSRTAVVLAVALTIMLSPAFAWAVPASAATGIPSGPAQPQDRPTSDGALAGADSPPATPAGAGFQPGGPLAGGNVSAGVAFARSTRGIASTNWAGYVATSAHGSFRHVGAVFFVPYIDCSATPDSYSAHWVGFDGESTNTVEQAGLLASCKKGVPHYSAWYEMFPRGPVYPHLAVKPGDSIRASVSYRPSTKKFAISLANGSTGRRFRASLPCVRGAGCDRASAEVISEAPSAAGRLLPLTDFRAITYSAIRIADQDGRRGGLRSRWWPCTPVIMVSVHGGAVVDQPTALYRGSAFSNYWMRSN